MHSYTPFFTFAYIIGRKLSTVKRSQVNVNATTQVCFQNSAQHWFRVTKNTSSVSKLIFLTFFLNQHWSEMKTSHQQSTVPFRENSVWISAFIFNNCDTIVQLAGGQSATSAYLPSSVISKIRVSSSLFSLIFKAVWLEAFISGVSSISLEKSLRSAFCFKLWGPCPGGTVFELTSNSTPGSFALSIAIRNASRNLFPTAAVTISTSFSVLESFFSMAWMMLWLFSSGTTYPYAFVGIFFLSVRSFVFYIVFSSFIAGYKLIQKLV